MTLEIIIAVVGIVLSVCTFVLGRNTAEKNDGKTEGMILSELGYLKSNTDEIKERLTKQEDKNFTIVSDIAELKKDIKTLYKMIDDIKKG